MRFLSLLLAFPALALPAAAGQDAGRVERLVQEVLDPLEFRLTAPELPGGLPAELEVVLEAPAGRRTLVLQRSAARAPGFRVRAQVEGGALVDVPVPEPRTYRGFVLEEPGAVAAASLGYDGLTAGVLGPDGDWFVVPLARVDAALAGRGHVAYRPSAAFARGACGAEGLVPGPEGEPGGGTASAAAGEGAPGCIAVCEIAYDVDHEYYLSAGSSVPQVVANIDAALAVVNVVYERDVQIRHEVTQIIVRTDVNDPYTATDPGERLDQFRIHWSSVQAGVPRDIAHFVMGLDVDGNIIGLAYVGVVCSLQWGYGWSQFTFPFDTNVSIMGHEIGHNWAAPHCLDPSCVIMCGGCLQIGPITQSVMIDHRDSRACLHAGPGSVTAVPPNARGDTAVANGPTRIDVLRNDADGNCDPVTILSHDATTLLGGTVERLVGAGPGGRDLLRYTPPAGYAGQDFFGYACSDGAGGTDTASVLVYVKSGDPELVARYGLDETGGSGCVDSSGNGLHGTYSGGPLLGRPGVLPGTGTSVELDGQNDRAGIPSGPPLGGLNGDLAVAAWVLPHGPNGYERVLGNDGSWAFGLSSSGLVFTTRNVKDYLLDASVPVGSWSHVAAVFDEGYDVHFYVDGEHAGTVVGAQPAGPAFPTWFIGALTTSGGFFDGNVDDLQVYGDALSGEQVRWLFQNPGGFLGGAPLGTPFCFGDGSGAPCPCGNGSATPGEGCRHAGGNGMLVHASGSASLAADDLVVTARGCPPFNSGIFYSGRTPIVAGNPLFDGLQCAGGDVRRYRGLFQSGGTASDTGFVAQDPSGAYFVPGVTYHFQYWSRDVASGPTPCGTGANFSPGVAVTASP